MITAMLLTGCSATTEVVEEAPVLRSVEVTALSKDSISSSFSYSGTANAAKEISVIPTIAGKVTNYNFEVGQKVSKNQVLFTVDTTDLNNNLRSVQASYDVAVLGVQNAENTYQNNLVLFEGGIISQAEMDQITYAYESATANLTSLEIQMEIIQKNIADCAVVSPMSGVITSRNVEVGGFATQSVPAYTVMDLSTIRVQVGVSEQMINSIALGDEVAVRMSAVSDVPLVGKVATVSPATSQTGTYAVTIELNNADGAIKAGMLAEVSFVLESAEDTIVLSRSAVLTKEEESYIFVVEDGVAKKVVVELGIESGETVQIYADLPEGTQVVTRGQTYLTDGESVNISATSVAEDTTEKEVE